MLNLVQKFGFDGNRQRARLELLGLTADCKRQCYRLQRDILRPAREEIVRDFLVWLRKHDELLKYLGNVDQDALRAGLNSYIETFAIINSETYFESRLRIGLTHWLLDIPVSLFGCGHRYIQQLIVDRINDACEPAEARELVSLALKLLALDLTLVSDTYRLAQVHHLVRSLKNQMDETRKLRVKASRDSLTGLPNREHLMNLADQSLRDARERGLAYGLVMLDIDHFKQVNDTYGHPAGDAVLVAVASIMQKALRVERGDDVVGRYGGEEFMIVLRGVRGQEFWAVTERLRGLIASNPVTAGQETISVTVSQGLAIATPDESLANVIKRADKALYDAKHGGRNRVVLADAGAAG